jgi:hypothetical protein
MKLVTYMSKAESADKRDFTQQCIRMNNNDNNNNPTNINAEDQNVIVDQQATLEDQRITKVEEGYIVPTPSILRETDLFAMPSEDVNHTDLLKTPLLLTTLAWDTSQTNNTNLYTVYIPQVFEIIPNFHQLMLQTYTYLKPTVNIHIQMNSTKFHLGKLIAFYDPMESMSTSISGSPKRYVNLYSATGQPNAILDAGYNNSITIKVPFEHILSYLTTNSAERAPQMGTIYLNVLNQLAVAAGTSPTISVNVLVSCSDVTLNMPIMPHTINVTSSLRKVAKHESKTIKLPGIIDSGSSIVKSGAGTVWNLMTGNWSKAADSGASTFSGVGNLLRNFDLDKPALPTVKTTNCLATVAPLAHMQGVDTSVRLAATPMGGYLMDTFSAAPREEMNISEIIKTKMMYNQINWSDAQAPGTQISGITIAPSRFYQVAPGSYAQTGYLAVIPTFLSYFNNFFQFWHGSVSIRMDFAATQFHSGRLIAVFFPNSSTTASTPLTLNTLMCNPYVIFDLMEDRTFEFTVPYVSSTARKRCCNPTNQDFSEFDELSIGTINIYVYTQLTHPDNVVGTIPINFYAGAGDDFRFEVPIVDEDFFIAGDTLPAISEPETKVARFESDTLPLRTEDRGSAGASVMMKGNNLVSNIAHFGEEIVDVRDLARRYTFVSQETPLIVASPTGLPTDILQYTSQLTLPTRPAVIRTGSIVTSVSSRNLVSAMSELYTFWSGSLRYKFLPFTTRVSPVNVRGAFMVGRSEGDQIISASTARQLYADTGFPLHIQNLSQDSGFEVEIPFYSYYNQCLTQSPYLPGNYDERVYQTGILNIVFNTYDLTSFPKDRLDPPNPRLPVVIFNSIGDDFKFRFLVSPPICYHRSLISS